MHGGGGRKDTERTLHVHFVGNILNKLGVCDKMWIYHVEGMVKVRAKRQTKQTNEGYYGPMLQMCLWNGLNVKKTPLYNNGHHC